MIGMILLILGFLCVAADITIPSGFIYPDYIKSEELGDYIQMYVRDNMLGDRVNFDVFPDILGYLLVLLGSIFLFKYSKKFLRGYLFLIMAAVFTVGLMLIPFYVNGRELIIGSLAISFFAMLAEVAMGYFFIYTLSEVTISLPTESNTRMMKFGWIGAAICRVMIYFLVIVGLDFVVSAYQFAMVGFTVFYLFHMFCLRNSLPNEKNRLG